MVFKVVISDILFRQSTYEEFKVSPCIFTVHISRNIIPSHHPSAFHISLLCSHLLFLFYARILFLQKLGGKERKGGRREEERGEEIGTLFLFSQAIVTLNGIGTTLEQFLHPEKPQQFGHMTLPNLKHLFKKRKSRNSYFNVFYSKFVSSLQYFYFFLL